MIGAGALGCEFLKSFSLMGISTNKNKKYNVIVTDNDNIMESNLNRQFLFRKDNIGEPKSKVACKKITDLNQSFNCISHQARVGPENEYIFTKDFWNKQNFIINAVDNIEARKYIANKCKIYHKILIDSGTNGTKANSQIIIRHKTIDYSPLEDNNSEQIPMCTLRNFPTSIEHCIEWARDNFDGYFIKKINNVKSFIEDKEKYYLELSKKYTPSDQIIKINEILKYIKIIINKDYEQCIKIALEEYNEEYYNSIIRTLNKNPPNSINEDGTRFWSGDKRCPTPLPFDIENQLALLFVEKYSIILANSMSIPLIDNNEFLKNKILDIKSTLIIDKEKSNLNTFKKKEYFEKKEINRISTIKKIELDKVHLNKLKNEINNFNIFELKENINHIFKIQEFEKDKDENGHIDFIFAAANLRAEIFQIEKCNKLKAKLISGKIIPAIATTTSAIVGLVCLQLYSLYQTNDIKYLRDNYLNLAINSFNFVFPGKYEEIEKDKVIKPITIKNRILNFLENTRNKFGSLFEKI